MKKQNILIALMAAVQFTHIVDFVIMMPLGPQLMRSMNINPAQFGLIVSSYTFSAAISGVIGAFFLDKYNRKSVLLLLYTGFIIGTFLCAFSNQYELLVAARIFTGAFGGLLGSLVLSIVGDAVPEQQRGKAIGIVMGAFSLASVIGIPIGLLFANQFGWSAPFYFVGALGLIISVFVIVYMADMKSHIELGKHKEKWYNTVNKITKSSDQRNALLLTFLVMSGHFTVISFLSPYMVSNVGFSENQLSLIYLIGGFVTFFTSPIIGKYSDKFGKKKVFIFFAILILPLILLVTNLPLLPVAIALTVTSIFFIVIGGRVIPATATVTSAVEPKQRGSFMAFNSSVQQLGSGFAAFVAGAIVYKNDAGVYEHFNHVGYLALGLNLLSIFIFLKIKITPPNGR
jgi:MFS transporter, DHA1 family, inner membrane transport protein